MVNAVPREVPRPKTLGACGTLGFGLGTSLGTPFTMIPPRLFQIMYNPMTNTEFLSLADNRDVTVPPEVLKLPLV